MAKGFACWYGEQRWFSIKTTFDEECNQLNWYVVGYEPNTHVHLFSEAGASSAGAVLSCEGTMPSFVSLGDVPLARVSIDPAANACQLAVLQHESAVSAAATPGLADASLQPLRLPGPAPQRANFHVALLGPGATGGAPVTAANEVLVRFDPDEPQWLRIRQVD